MNETDTVFLQTVGRFIVAQLQLGLAPLVEHIKKQDELIEELQRQVADGRDGVDGKDGKDGRDGADAINFLIDRDGHLVVALSDGKTKDVGQVVGRDGKDGTAGAPGKDGRDGFGFDDMGIEYDGEKTFTFYFVRGDEKKTFAFPTALILYRGVWRQGAFLKGDAVTYDGSMFIAKADTETMPGTATSDWQLATKRGRDGKSGEKGDTGPTGKDGRHGRDLTQLGPDGSKW